MILFPAELAASAARHPYPLLFATVSGAHLYGFASADSDWDLRGAHILPAREVLQLDCGHHTISRAIPPGDAVELDLVTHDVGKFFALMLRRNGYVLEQLYSPLIVHSTPEHTELLEIGRLCVTRFHAYHYRGFAKTQWDLFEKEQPRRVKPLLYVYRVLLTGIHLMRSGLIEANLGILNEAHHLVYVADMMAQKIGGAEKQVIRDEALDFHRHEYDRLQALLETEQQRSSLPAEPTAKHALNALLVRLRLATLNRVGE